MFLNWIGISLVLIISPLGHADAQEGLHCPIIIQNIEANPDARKNPLPNIKFLTESYLRPEETTLREQALQVVSDNPGVDQKTLMQKLDASQFLPLVQTMKTEVELEKQLLIQKYGIPTLKNSGIAIFRYGKLIQTHNKASLFLQKGAISYWDLLELTQLYQYALSPPAKFLEKEKGPAALVRVRVQIDFFKSRFQDRMDEFTKNFPNSLYVPTFENLNHVDISESILFFVNRVGLLKSNQRASYDGQRQQTMESFTQHDFGHGYLLARYANEYLKNLSGADLISYFELQVDLYRKFNSWISSLDTKQQDVQKLLWFYWAHEFGLPMIPALVSSVPQKPGFENLESHVKDIKMRIKAKNDLGELLPLPSSSYRLVDIRSGMNLFLQFMESNKHMGTQWLKN